MISRTCASYLAQSRSLLLPFQACDSIILFTVSARYLTEGKLTKGADFLNILKIFHIFSYLLSDDFPSDTASST